MEARSGARLHLVIFQTFWQDAYNLDKETEIAAGSRKYSANAVLLNNNSSNSSTVANFGNVFAVNASIISQLLESNTSMSHEVK